MTPIFYATATAKGTIEFDLPVFFRRHVKSLAPDAVEVIVRKRRTQRSIRQNKYYWKVIIGIVAEELGYTKDEAHEALAWHFLQVQEGDERLPKRRSTTDLTVQEFEAYALQCRVFAAQTLGLDVPEPNEIDLG